RNPFSQRSRLMHIENPSPDSLTSCRNTLHKGKASVSEANAQPQATSAT
ncbi:MAG: hypothetical protein ACI8W7_005101, partial [Gammaproteobacteria bacterium]